MAIISIILQLFDIHKKYNKSIKGINRAREKLNSKQIFNQSESFIVSVCIQTHAFDIFAR